MPPYNCSTECVSVLVAGFYDTGEPTDGTNAVATGMLFTTQTICALRIYYAL